MSKKNIKNKMKNILKLEEIKIHLKLRVFSVAVVLPLLMAIFFMIYTINNIYKENLYKYMLKETDFVAQKYYNLELKTKLFTKILSTDSKIMRGVQLKKMSLVIDSLENFAKELDIPFSAVYDTDGYSLGKSHKPKEFFKNDSNELYFKRGIEGRKNIEAEIFETSEGVILMSTAQLFSVYDESTINGIIVGGYILNNELAKKIKADSNAQIVFVKRGKIIGSTFEKIENEKLMELIGYNTQKEIYRVKVKNIDYEAKAITTELAGTSEKFQIIVLVDFSKEKSMISKSFIGITVAIIICLIITIILESMISKKIEEPIQNLEDVSKEIMEKNYNVRAHILGNDEIALLGTSMNKMLDEILTMNTELEEKVKERTCELENSMDSLKNTQKQLIESEKMAALGGLVAGIAHEINTPIGVCLTAASFMKDNTEKIARKYNNKDIEAEDLEEYMEVAADTTEIVIKNIKRADELIHSFKLVAVDQTSEEKRKFNVKAYIEIILQSLYPKLKRTKHKIEVICSENIEITGYPGSLHQILSNLILNSLIHGFEGIDIGEIKISVKEEGTNIIMVYEDNGRGMPKENIEKIYEPFFTTKRGQGGSGLGMNIVYNIVTRKLGGFINVTSAPNNGIKFEIIVPKQ